MTLVTEGLNFMGIKLREIRFRSMFVTELNLCRISVPKFSETS